MFSQRPNNIWPSRPTFSAPRWLFRQFHLATFFVVIALGPFNLTNAQNSNTPVLRGSSQLGNSNLPVSGSTASANQRSNEPNAISSILGGNDRSLSETVQELSDGNSATDFLLQGPDVWTSREGLSSSLQIMLMLTVLSLAPAVLLMTTCYVRIIVVMGLLRTALGTPQLPPSQVITSIALFMTLFVMTPVWNKVYTDAIEPYTAEGSTMSLVDAWEKGAKPIRDFMARQINMAKNHDDVHMFYAHYAPDSPAPESFDDVPLQVLLPAYMLSELKTAFMMGFIIYLPFLILDVVVASVTISMGMMMLPPAMISMPFKLLLFVLLDGWQMVVGMLLSSFGTYGGT
jgi:flagellar biosynthetic protein FliP